MSRKPGSSCPSCPQLMFRCGVLLFILLTLVMFMLIENQDENINAGIRVRRRDDTSDEEVSDDLSYDSMDENLVESPIHIAMVTCGDRSRVNQTLLSMKSIILLSTNAVHFHLFADGNLQADIVKQVSFMPVHISHKFVYTLYSADYPGPNPAEWRALFKPCSSLRLFLPSLLPRLDSVIYLDSDTLALAPIEHLHSFFSRFNESHSVALAPESLQPSVAWYNRFARHPYYGELGLNSGVMLMNLTRLRQTTWAEDVPRIYNEHKLDLVYGDQDIINIWTYYHPDQIYELPCEYNYVTVFCAFGHFCRSAEQHGIKIVHGNKGSFHKPDYPVFMRVHQVFKEYTFDTDLRRGILDPLISAMAQPPKYGCGQVSSLFYMSYQKALDG